VQLEVEKRKHRRYDIALNVRVKPRKRTAAAMETSSKNISAHGVYFSLPEGFTPGTAIELELDLPFKSEQGKTVRVRCKGKVARVEPVTNDGIMGVGATIDYSEFFNESKPRRRRKLVL
jgi:hypothetical protein